MPGDESPAVVAADKELWSEYDRLATRAYGHRVEDITRLYDHADARVALRGGRVVAGGLGLLVPQFFGGRPVLSACLAAGCVAPEERGGRLGLHVIGERIRVLRERGALLATAWTTSTGYGHRAGWEAPAQVFSWCVPTDELRRSFDAGDFEITHGTSPGSRALQHTLAAGWNGPMLRPDWWEPWKHDTHGLTAYRFHRPGEEPAGLLSLAFDRHPADGNRVVVHDFWAADDRATAAMFAFLGRHNSRIGTVLFQRTSLPPHPLLPHRLHRAGRAAARHWHPWMLRILDPLGAVRARGWPADVELTLALELAADGTGPSGCHVLRIASGTGELEAAPGEGAVRLTDRQFAVWYAGGYRTATAATLAGVRGEPDAVTRLVRATADREPWLPEYF